MTAINGLESILLYKIHTAFSAAVKLPLPASGLRNLACFNAIKN